MTDTHVIEALVEPSKAIRKGYETVSILTTDGQQIVGMMAAQDNDSITLRLASDLSIERVIPRNEIDATRVSDHSMMPDGLLAWIGEQRDFMDLAKYIMEVAAGGPSRAAELKPSPEEIKPRDDTLNLDHAGIIEQFRNRDFEAGKSIYHGYCSDCHGNDGNTPSLPTARAFGTQKLKFGADPYRMFITLSRGNGLMAPMRHLTPNERYQVVHYVREQFMKPSNPDYRRVDDAYLAGLPKGTLTGTETPMVRRDYGPALASQLRRDFSSVLTIQLDQMTISYDLHTMNPAAIWRDGFLDLSNTQHARDRGEGTAIPSGNEILPLLGWQWGHDETLDYPTEDLLPRGPLPSNWMDYHGYYRHGNEVVLSYQIDGRPILESPQARDGIIVQRIKFGPGAALKLAVAGGDTFAATEARIMASDEGAAGTFSNSGSAVNAIAAVLNTSEEGVQEFVAAAVLGEASGFTWYLDEQKRLVLNIPESQQTRSIEILRTSDEGHEALQRFVEESRRMSRQDKSWSLRSMTEGGPMLWPDVLETTGFLGLERTGYALDTLTLPDNTPWNTWFRTSALDFFADGRMVLSTYGGDIWIVSGIDQDLQSLRWKRFAGGLYEPFGVKVVNDQVYVTCKDRLVRLHDLNQDDEADFYESFSADTDVSVNFHAFSFDLQTDREGNFYYAKSGHGSDSDLPGSVVKVSKDGRKREVYCTGFRTPNGMGMLPDGRPIASDNQGQWMPASKINLLRPGGFYGWVPTYSIPGMWSPGGGTIDLDKVVPPTSFDQPVVWMPQDFDNSSGGQLWVDDARFGPLAGHLLHTSFGKGWMSYLMMQDVDGITQGAIIKLAFDFRTGIMRARVNPKDGQVYATGLQGWNGGGRVGLLDSGLQRLRFTGTPDFMVIDCQVEHDGLRIDFNAPLDPDASTELSAYSVEQWNYHWRREYGSDQYSPTTDEVGTEKVRVESVSISADSRSVKLHIADLIPVDQLHLILRVKREDGKALEEEIYWTIHKVPGS